jgi:hypothetical protein
MFESRHAIQRHDDSLEILDRLRVFDFDIEPNLLSFKVARFAQLDFRFDVPCHLAFFGVIWLVEGNRFGYAQDSDVNEV